MKTLIIRFLITVGILISGLATGDVSVEPMGFGLFIEAGEEGAAELTLINNGEDDVYFETFEKRFTRNFRIDY